jgi:ADP-ribose pyrophosphatase YjhB (NUDIX family)
MGRAPVVLAMGVAARTREAVEERLAALQETYDGVTVNQTTISLPADRFRAVTEEYTGGLVDAYVAVRNRDDEVLHVNAEEGLELPGTATGRDEPLERSARRAVEDATGVVCRIDGLREVTIAGMRNADDPDAETVYRLVVVFSAEYLEGAIESEAQWAERAREAAPVYV